MDTTTSVKVKPGILERGLPGRLFYGWYVVGAAAINNFFVLGVAILGLGAFYEPMRAELGWSMAAITFGISVRMAVMSMVAGGA